jgi:class 3 adenylate cyclase
VNVAARLMQNAAAGEILLGPGVCGALGEELAREGVGERRSLRLKGKAGPVEVAVLAAAP